MEYCSGGSIGDILKILDRPLNEDQISIVCKSVLKGLNYIHNIGKVHRDIKGGNILLTQTGHVKLADFGVSAKLQGTFQKRNTFAGTPYWMAPEVILEDDYDGRADIWSLGITAIEMAEINPPHADVHPWRVLFLIPKEPSPTLSKKANWSRNFQFFVSSCLKKVMPQRPNAEELLMHPFVQNCKRKSVLVELIEECHNIIEKRGFALYESDSEEGLMATEEDKEELRNSTGTINNIDCKVRKKKIKKIQDDPENDFQNLCKDNTIQLPYLNLNYISPLNLIQPCSLSEINHMMMELTHNNASTTQNQANISKAISTNPYLLNILKTFSYHHQKEQNLAMNEKILDESLRIQNELSAALKTVLRI